MTCISSIQAAAKTARRFQDALLTARPDNFVPLLGEQVVLSSPIRFQPYVGREAGCRLLAAIGEVFSDVAYGESFVRSDAAAIVFGAQVGGRTVQGAYILAFNDVGEIVDLTVFLRPASGLEAARLAMSAALGSPSAQ